MITPLHNHSHYSALDGFATVREIADRVEALGCPCCGLTDHAVVSGHLDFYQELTGRGIKPILGCEMYHGVRFGQVKGAQRDQAHLILLAQTDEGLRNLWRLIDWTAVDDERFHHVGRANWDAIERHNEGLIATSACALGLVPQGLLKGDTEPLNRYLDIFGDRFRIEISTYPEWQPWGDTEGGDPLNAQVVNELLIEYAQERGIPIIIGDDAHKATKDQFAPHNAFLSTYGRQNIYTPVEERKMYHPPESLYIHSEEEVREALHYLPDHIVDEAIANTIAIGEMCNAHPPEVGRHMPVFVPTDCPWLSKTDTRSASEVFVDLVEAGIYERYGDTPSQEVWDRAFYEMETLINDGIDHYFLMGWDEVQFTQSENIEMGPGRGSSAGCLVAYALGITDVCPLHYGLIFERFWNSGRAKGFPDIDSDFEMRSRRSIREYLRKRWGHDHVRSIGTVGRMMPKAVIDRLWQPCDVTFQEKEDIKKIVANNTQNIDILGPKQIGWSRQYEPGKRYYVEDCNDKIDEYISQLPVSRQDKVTTFVDLCAQSCNRISQYGVHASGIAIADIALPDYAPAYLRGKAEDKVAATMFAMDDIDRLGLNKLDVLGLRTLDTLAAWKQQMAAEGIEITWSGLDREVHPAEMWDMIANQFTAGIFQLETAVPSRLCVEFKPRSIEELAIIGAIIRPGPNQAIDSFLIRRNGGKDEEFDGRNIPLLKDILDPTYGWFLYQEQVIAFFNAMGYDPGESDAVRKILGKKLPVDMEKLKNGEGEWAGRGYFAMAAASGINDHDAHTIWNSVERFAEYSFNKSHAICYAVIGFRCLYAKYYAPAQFYMACIRTVDGDKRKEMLPLYINEARRLGIEVHPPDIRYSKNEISVQQGNIYFGFSDIKHVGASGHFLVEMRDNHGWDISTPEALGLRLEAENEAFLAKRKQGVRDGAPLPKSLKSPKQNLQENKIGYLFQAGAWDGLRERDVSLSEIQAEEEELLGVILTDNSKAILDNNWDVIQDCDQYSDVQAPLDEEIDTKYRLCGTISHIRTTRTKKRNESMAFVTIGHEGSELEFTVFPQQWRSYKKFLFKPRAVGIFTIRRSPKGLNFEEGHLLK